MTIMVRPKGLGKRIAFKILGVPPALAFKPTEKQKKLDERLTVNETQLLR